MYIGIQEKTLVGILVTILHKFTVIEPNITKIIYGIISAKIDFNRLVLKIKYTKIGQAIRLIKVLYGAGITVIESIAIKENIDTYKSLCFLLEDIFKRVVKSNIVITTSKIPNGILISLIKFTFSVVNAVHIVCIISIF
ncbi:MAG: hypothetical protein ACI4UX_00840 [Clostridia bacterium]